MVAGAAQAASPSREYQPRWESLDRRPTPGWFTDAKFGIIIHWGLYSVPAWSVRGEYSEWYWNRIMDPHAIPNPWRVFHDRTFGQAFSYPQFAPQFRAELFDPDQWARIFAASGAKYFVPTSKHHDGFCLWPSAEANRAWGRPWNSVDAGPRRDLLGDLTRAVRKQGLKMGFYYSLYEWYNPLWLKDKKRYAVEHMGPQFKDVVGRYAPSIIFADGEWDMPSTDWQTPELLAWLFNESPCRDDVVINDRWGKECRHKHGGYWTTEYGAGMPSADHPWEEDRGMAYSFGYSRTEVLEDYRTGQDLVWMLADLVSRGGNLMLDVGPTADGRIPVVMQDRLSEIGRWLAVNGEAIYGTRTWKNTCQWTDGQQPRQGYGQFRVKYDVAKMVGAHPVEGQAQTGLFHHQVRRALRDSAPLARQDVHAEGRHARWRRPSADVRREGAPLLPDRRRQHGDPHAGRGVRRATLQIRLDAQDRGRGGDASVSGTICLRFGKQVCQAERESRQDRPAVE